jgi:hypothetical protein
MHAGRRIQGRSEQRMRCMARSISSPVISTAHAVPQHRTTVATIAGPATVLEVDQGQLHLFRIAILRLQ